MGLRAGNGTARSVMRITKKIRLHPLISLLRNTAGAGGGGLCSLVHCFTLDKITENVKDQPDPLYKALGVKQK